MLDIVYGEIWGKNMKYDCLIVDDESILAETTSDYFNVFGVNCTYVESAEECIEFLKENEVSLILLDINLGRMSGFELCKKLRATIKIPILFISARSSEDDILIALNIGGDDYIQKPYTLSILLAKVKVVLKRYYSNEENSIIKFGKVEVDLYKSSVKVDNNEIKLKGMEYKLLIYLLKNKNKLITKDELFSNVWEETITGDNTLNVHIRYLREKIEENPNDPKYIQTVCGRGYIFKTDL